MTRPHFTLTVATSADGFIARGETHTAQEWASAEEQALFFRDVESADWSIMGRNTHLAAERPNRRRIVFSTSRAGWQRPAQVWVDPATMTPAGLGALVARVHPHRRGLILGGTRVHDWFLSHAAIDRVHLTVEPIRFGAGLPVFSGQGTGDPLALFVGRGFVVVADRVLNKAGTRYYEMEPETA